MNVPLRQRPYGLADLLAYDRVTVELMGKEIRRADRPVVLLDCGADIGLISARLVATCPQIDRVIAFEPNRSIVGTLAENMALLAVDAEAKCAAVADFQGRGELVHPPHSTHDHAAYLAPTPSGDVSVTRIDDQALPSDRGIALKIDVEGGELAVLRGATHTLERAPWFLVAFEANRLQSERAGIEPLEIVEEIVRLRSCELFAVSSVAVHAAGPQQIRYDRPFFSQFERNNYNIVAVSR